MARTATMPIPYTSRIDFGITIPVISGAMALPHTTPSSRAWTPARDREDRLNRFHLHQVRWVAPFVAVAIPWAIFALPIRAAGVLVLLVGPPASGRTTQAEFLRKDLG